MKRLPAANYKDAKAVIAGIKPYGCKPHETVDPQVARLIGHYRRDLGRRKPFYYDLRPWKEHGVIMLRHPDKRTTSILRRLPVYNPKVIIMLFGACRVYLPYLQEIGADVRVEPPFFKTTDDIDWTIS